VLSVLDALAPAMVPLHSKSRISFFSTTKNKGHNAPSREDKSTGKTRSVVAGVGDIEEGRVGALDDEGRGGGEGSGGGRGDEKGGNEGERLEEHRRIASTAVEEAVEMEEEGKEERKKRKEEGEKRRNLLPSSTSDSQLLIRLFCPLCWPSRTKRICRARRRCRCMCLLTLGVNVDEIWWKRDEASSDSSFRRGAAFRTTARRPAGTRRTKRGEEEEEGFKGSDNDGTVIAGCYLPRAAHSTLCGRL
jgi:hypothetical protein